MARYFDWKRDGLLVCFDDVLSRLLESIMNALVFFLGGFVAYQYWNRRWQIGRFFDVPLIVTGAWFGFVFLLTGPVVADGNYADAWRTLWTILLAYSCVVIHEYGHALTAKKLGYSVKEISLWPFSGLAMIQGDWHKSWRDEFLIAIMGPFTNAVMLLISLTVYALWPGGISTVLQDFIIVFVVVNGVLFCFNLLPTYPMDGGRIVRALATRRYKGDWWRATKLATKVGIVTVIFIAPLLWIYWSPIPAVLISVMVFFGIGEKIELGKAKEKEELKRELEKWSEVKS